MDVVTSSSGDLSWLSAWQDQLAGKHVIVAHEPGLNVQVATAGLDVTLVTRDTLKVKGVDTTKLSTLDIGLLSCTQKFVLVLGEGCVPATNPAGRKVGVIQEHTQNLTTPSTPYFFNTLYDPYRPGTDFVRGYPFSLREGRPTAASHGLWLTGQPDSGAGATQQPTQATQPVQTGSERYVDATLTLPKEALCVLSPRNLAVDRELVGVALYSGPPDMLPGQGFTRASYCLKAVCNHLGYGIKTGLPYVRCAQAGSSGTADAAAVTQQQAHQDAMLNFFSSVQLSSSSRTAQQAYLELAAKVRDQLGSVDSVFKELAAGMEAWVQAYTAAFTA